MDPPVERSRALYWWVLSAVLIAVGIFGVAYALTRPSVGPNLNKPIGVTSLQSWQSSGAITNQASQVRASITNVTTEANAVTISQRKGSSSRTSLASLAHVAPLKGRSRPVHIQIPSIGVSASVGVLGLNHDGSVQVPTDFEVPGWYKYGPAPGQKGSAVILGHVDSYKGPAVFFLVKDLKIGSRVNVTLANHTIVRFKVIGVREYSKGHFPSRLVYGNRSYSALQLVTCGGVFDRATGHYESNIVAFTALVGKTVPRRI
jgi:sortase (surface protein transpeptidase)